MRDLFKLNIVTIINLPLGSQLVAYDDVCFLFGMPIIFKSHKSFISVFIAYI